jgi:transposase
VSCECLPPYSALPIIKPWRHIETNSRHYIFLSPAGCAKDNQFQRDFSKSYKAGQSPFKPLATLGKTRHQWREEVARMWRFTKSNGITEGFHRKMKLIQRRAYGFRNFENYRLRVKVLCSSTSAP